MKRVRDEVRILLIGDRNVGKTSLILSLVRKPKNQEPCGPFHGLSFSFSLAIDQSTLFCICLS